jgi:hypothetical protein
LALLVLISVQGFEAKIVQSVLTSAIVFGSYEALLSALEKRHRGANQR